MALDFPSSPTIGQVYTSGGRSWTWDGTSWVNSTATSLSNVSGTLAVANGGTGTSNGSITGTTALTFTAGGTNQDINLVPSGTGSVAASKVAITGGTITGITDLAVADGGTGASDAATARTNLGLGSISTQAASNVSITGGSITGTPISGSTGSFTTLAASGTATVGGLDVSGAAAAAYFGGFTTNTNTTGYVRHILRSGTGGSNGNAYWLYVPGSFSKLATDSASEPIILSPNNTNAFTVTTTGINATAIGATTPSTGAFTTLAGTTLNIGSAPNANSRAWALNGFGYINGANGNGIEWRNSTSTNSSYITNESGDILRFNFSGGQEFYAAGAIKAAISSTGLAVTGTLSASGVFDFSSGVATTLQDYIAQTGASGRRITNFNNSAASGSLFSIRSHGASYSETLFGQSISGSTVLIASSGKLIIGTNTTSGLDIGVNGGVVGAFSSTGLAVTGTGTFGSTGSGSYSVLIANNDQSNVRLRFQNTGASGQTWSIVGGSPGASNAGLAVYNETGAATVAQFSSTGLAVTGTLTSTGNIALASNNAYLQSKTSAGVSVSLLTLTNDASNITRFLAGVDAGGFQWTNQSQSASWMSLSSTGLAVTGQLSTVNGGSTPLVNYTQPSGGYLTIPATGDGYAILYDHTTTGEVRHAAYSQGGTAFHTFYTASGGVSAKRLQVDVNGLAVTGTGTFTTGSGTATTIGLAQTGVIRWDITNEAASGLLKIGVNGGGTVLTLTNATGLAVTGTLGASGTVTAITVGNSGAAAFNSAFVGSTHNGISLCDSSDTSGAAFAVFKKANGTTIGGISRVTTTDAVAFNTTSDARRKTNIHDFTSADSGRLIDGLRPRWFDWKNSDENGKGVIGFVAQEVNAVDPALARIGAVTVGDDDPDTITKHWAVDPSKLVPVLVAELKSLRARVAALENTKE